MFVLISCLWGTLDLNEKNKPHIVHLLTPVWPDRDDFIQINEENIEDEMKPNFLKRPHGDADFGIKGSVNTEHSPYDVVSAQVLRKEVA